jgi:hypothetical protein
VIPVAVGVLAGYLICGLVYVTWVLFRVSPRGYPGANGAVRGRALTVEWARTVGMLFVSALLWPGILLARSRDTAS